MKVNKMEAPEKIYLFKNPISEEVDYRWLSNRSCDDDVEYIRKDAFIKKACEFISKHIESDKYVSPDEESYRAGCPYDYFETSMFIEDFKKYMEE